MQTIIIAVLVLLVLGILAYFLIQGAGRFTRGVGECKEKGGECLPSCQPANQIQLFRGCYVQEGGEDVYKEDNVCCIKAG